jgi:hypothetical protein
MAGIAAARFAGWSAAQRRGSAGGPHRGVVRGVVRSAAPWFDGWPASRRGPCGGPHRSGVAWLAPQRMAHRRPHRYRPDDVGGSAPTLIQRTLIQPTWIEPTWIEPTVIEPTWIEPTVIEPTVISPPVIHPRHQVYSLRGRQVGFVRRGPADGRGGRERRA